VDFCSTSKLAEHTTQPCMKSAQNKNLKRHSIVSAVVVHLAVSSLSVAAARAVVAAAAAAGLRLLSFFRSVSWDLTAWRVLWVVFNAGNARAFQCIL
jgi:hypothetical protein